MSKSESNPKTLVIRIRQSRLKMTKNQPSRSSKRQKRAQASTSRVVTPPDYDDSRFISKEAQTYFYSVLTNESLVESLFFDYASLRSVGLDIEPKFNQIGIGSFVARLFPVHDIFVREFYANLTHGFNDSRELVIYSRVNNKDIQFCESDMHAWFGLKCVGYKCTGAFEYTIEEVNAEHMGDQNMICGDNSNKEYALRWLKEKSCIQDSEKALDCNAFGVEMRMVHSALTRTLTPKVHTQSILRGVDLEIMYHVLNNNEVNLCFVVMTYMINKAVLMFRDSYKAEERERKSGIPYGAILTHIFNKCGVNLSESKGIKVHRNLIVRDSYLRTMKYYRTLNNGWMFYKHIAEGELMFDGTQFRAAAPGPPPRSVPSSSEARPSTRVTRPPSSAAGTLAPSASDPLVLARLTAIENDIYRLKFIVESGFASIRNMIRSVADKAGCSTSDILQEP